MDGDGWMWGHGWGGWMAMWGVMALFWAVLIAAVVLAVRYLSAADTPPQTPSAPGSAPEDLLAQRFARGEIDEDEYRQRLAVLLEHHSQHLD